MDQKEEYKQRRELHLVEKIILIALLVFGSVGVGYYLRLRVEKTSPVVIQQIKQVDQNKHLQRFQIAAATVADSAHLKPGQTLAIYVYLVQSLIHPCPLPDNNLQDQCRKLLTLSRNITPLKESEK